MTVSLPRGLAALLPLAAPTQAGARFLVAGFGVTVRGDGKTGGTLRTAPLSATGRPGNLQLRLVDPQATTHAPALAFAQAIPARQCSTTRSR